MSMMGNVWISKDDPASIIPRETPLTTKIVKLAQNKKQSLYNYRQNDQTMLQYSYPGAKRPRQEGALP